MWKPCISTSLNKLPDFIHKASTLSLFITSLTSYFFKIYYDDTFFLYMFLCKIFLFRHIINESLVTINDNGIDHLTDFSFNYSLFQMIIWFYCFRWLYCSIASDGDIVLLFQMTISFYVVQNLARSLTPRLEMLLVSRRWMISCKTMFNYLW